ncbi:stage III sporulation protein AF [Virgibacillus dakarensis]|uniref:stage III sporulation protein AF n=1 Tax=Virgibacillus dakarensis TaxID=1917889 RepID=UPI000B43ACED|nr:stage III sporulation protein AF [Virgibacillus dakarensis]MBT2214421.1 stage III sporulation protein AF [Virgibacillus dakarensis]
MDLLVEWVTQIVVFLIVAMIIDLIIPATVMKKYIKLVVGLILILIFLKPVFSLFDMNVEQALEASFSKLTKEESAEGSMENSIEMQKKEIQATQSAYILEEMAVQLKDLAKDKLAEDYQAKILDINFQLTTEEEPTYEDLEEVIVYLGQMEEEEGAVSTVDRIEINTDDPVVNEDEQDVQGIKNLLQDVWEINDDKLTIVWEGGSP